MDRFSLKKWDSEVLFVSNSGLHGELLFSLISRALPFNWDKGEFGKLRQNLSKYHSIVIDCHQFALYPETGLITELLEKIIHPKKILINFPADLPELFARQAKDLKLELVCDDNTNREVLIRKLGQALQGQEQDSTNRLNGSISQQLTRREHEILSRLIEGESNSIIATKLHLSEHTVKNHMYNIFRKIGVQNRLQACNWAKTHLVASQP